MFMVPVRRYSAVNDNSDFRLHRSTGEQADAPVAIFAVDAECVQQLRNGNLINRSIDHDPERSLLVVLHHQDDRLGKARIAHLGLGYQ
jgi:hypothetical protein